MNKPLKFCMVTTFYPPYNFGGDGIFVSRLANALARRGHFVDVFHCEDSFLMLNKTAPIVDFANHQNVTVHRLKSGKGFMSPLLTQQTGATFFKRQLKAALEKNDYDVIHYHNMSLIGIKALSYGRSAVKLYTTHEHWLVCPMHVLWKFDRETCQKKSCLRCQIHGKKPPQLWRFTGFLERMLKHIDCFVSPSRFTARKHREMGLDASMFVLPHFLPLPETESFSPESKHARPFFLFVGRLEKIKGVQKLIPVFKNKPDYDLLVAGDGEYREALFEQAKNCPNIKFLGRLDRKHLHSLYQSAIAVVVPSICFGTFGIIVIEAFQNKTPVIVSNLGALPEIVEESGGGIIYENQKGLTEAVNRLADDSRLRNELGEKGYAAFMKYWTEDAHLAQYFELIEKLQKTKKKPRRENGL